MANRRITSDEALKNILAFVDDSDGEESDVGDLGELYDSDDEEVVGDRELENTLDEEPELEIPAERHRKLLTKNRLVNSIDAALDMANYNPLIIRDESSVYKKKLTDPDDRKKSEEMVFTSKQPIHTGRQRACDVLKEPSGLKGGAANANTAVDAFNLFVTNEMLEIIVTNTNRNIQKILRVKDVQINTSKYPCFETNNH